MSNEWLIVVDGKAFTPCSMKISVPIMAWSNTCCCTIYDTLFSENIGFFLKWCRSASSARAGECFIMYCWNASVWDFSSQSLNCINSTVSANIDYMKIEIFNEEFVMEINLATMSPAGLSCYVSILCTLKLFWKHRNSNVENPQWMIWINFCLRLLIWMELFYWNSLWTIRYVCFAYPLRHPHFASVSYKIHWCSYSCE